jgi:hypothetical protein
VTGHKADTAFVAIAALAARFAFVGWAGTRFPATADGTYYEALARRIAHGDGYTWAWPDGAVTYAAHYPVGYPALLAGAYALAGASPVVVGLVNAVIGSVAAVGAHRLLLEATSRKLAYAGAIAVAIHPALVAYTPAVMTEGITAALLVGAGALAMCGGWRWLALGGVLLGVATLVRPQCLLLAPALGALAMRGARARVKGALLATCVVLACCAPWTARNCVRMHRCALVSVNGGWNLLIGAQTTTGAWADVSVPPQCREVWDEAAKDACFERAARDAIARAPAAWLARASKKLAVTFDHFGAAPWYLHTSNAEALPDVDRFAWDATELVVSRVLLIAALIALARAAGPRARERAVIAALGAVFALSEHAWPAYLALVGMAALLGLRRAPLLVAWSAAVVLAVALAHAAFFGAGRYGLMVAPFVTALAFVRRGTPMPPVASASLASSAR